MSRSNAIARNQILIGDAGERLRTLPDSSIDMVVTSPPYFRLRNYQEEGQLGLEEHVDDWVKNLGSVAGQLRRVLTPTGTFWLSLGDTYSTHPSQGAGRKGLLLAPERLALRLSQDGWLLRNKIVWAKTNGLPTSTKDRLACHYEVVYLLAKQPRYHFDLDAIRQPLRSRPPTAKAGAARTAPGREDWRGPNGQSDSGLKRLHALGRAGHPLGKNPGDVWRFSTSNYRGAHFATFPEALVERIIRAGCPEQRCLACRAPWRRTVRRAGATALLGQLQPSCDCLAASQPGLVLDPFMGAGTTAVAAEGLGREWLGIELNPDFAALAQERLEVERGHRATKAEIPAAENTTKRKEVA